MFDQKRDKEIIEKSIRNSLNKKHNERKKQKLKRYYNLLVVIKIVCMYIFAFIGFSLFFYHFILGQPYQCAFEDDKDTEEQCIELNFLNHTEYKKLDEDIINCETELIYYKEQYNKLENQTRIEYLRELLSGICQEIS